MHCVYYYRVIYQNASTDGAALYLVFIYILVVNAYI